MRFTSEERLELATAAHQAGELDKAERLYKLVLLLEPEHAVGYNNLGALAVGIGKVEYAIQFYERAVEIMPNALSFWLSYIDAFLRLGEISLAQKILQRAKQFVPPSAKLKRMDNILSPQNLNKKPPKTNLKQIVDLIKQRKLIQALSVGENLARIFPKDASIANSLGFINQLLNRTEEARRNYKKCTTLSPQIPDAYIKLGNVLSSLERDKEAIEPLKRAACLNPSSPHTYDVLANSFLKLGSFKGSISTIDKTLCIRLPHTNILNNLGAAWIGLEQFEKAAPYFLKLLILQPNNPETMKKLLDALVLDNRFRDAFALYRKLFAIIDPNSSDFNKFGSILIKLNQYTNSTNYFRKAILLDPQLASPYNNLGLALTKLGKHDIAISIYYRALSLIPSHLHSLNNFGVAMQELSYENAASRSFRKTLVLDPLYSKAYWNLSGLSSDLSSAQKLLTHSKISDSSNVLANVMLAGLKAVHHQGKAFNDLTAVQYKDHSLATSFQWYLNLKNQPKVYFSRFTFFDEIIKISDTSRPFYEFGVWTGISFRYLLKSFPLGYGFDTFSGLPEDWHSEGKGSYSSEGMVPNIEGGNFIKGKFEETLPKFFSKPRPLASLINFDADLYSSTLCALHFSKTIIDNKTLLIFDEFITNSTWEMDEYKALNDFCDALKISYEVIAVSFMNKQVAVRLNI